MIESTHIGIDRGLRETFQQSATAPRTILVCASSVHCYELRAEHVVIAMP